MIWYWALRVWLVNDDFIAGTSRGGLSRQLTMWEFWCLLLLEPGGGSEPALGPPCNTGCFCVVKMLYDSRSQGLEKCEEKLFLFIFCSNYPVFVTWSFYSFLCFFVLTKCLMSEFKINFLECLNTCFHGKAFFEDTCEEESQTCVLYERGRRKLSSDTGRGRMVLVDCSCLQLNEVNLSSKPFYLPMLSKSRKPKSRSPIIWPAAQQVIFDLSLLSSPSCFIHETQTSDHHHLVLALFSVPNRIKTACKKKEKKKRPKKIASAIKVVQ